MPSDEESERIQHTGFIAGMLRTRRGLDPEMGEPEIPRDRLDPFMVGYRQGAKARDEIVTEATTIVPTDGDEVLRQLINDAEDYLAQLASGIADDDNLRQGLALARVHLSRKDAADD